MASTAVSYTSTPLDGQMSPDQQEHTTGDMFVIIVHAVVFLLGVPGNCLILRVYLSKARMTSTHVFISALAWADLSVCLMRLRRISVEALLLDGRAIPIALAMAWALETMSVGTSTLITALIAADRYDCVRRPHNRFFDRRRAKVTVGASVVFSLAISIPAFIGTSKVDPSSEVLMRMVILAFQILCFSVALILIIPCYGLVYLTIRKHVRIGVRPDTMRDGCVTKSGESCSTVLVPTTTSRIRETNIATGVLVALKSDQVNASPASNVQNMDFASVSGKGVSVISSPNEQPVQNLIHQSQLVATRKGVSSGGQSMLNERGLAPKSRATSLQRKTTKMLFITSVVFLLTWVPYWTRIGVELASYGGATVSPTLASALERSSAALFINNAVNPIIYGISNRRFRKDCWEVLCKLRRP